MPGDSEGQDPDDGGGPPSRAGLSPWRVGAWTAELLSVPVGLVDAYLPGRSAIRARTREQLIVVVSEVNGARTAAWVHGAWLDFLGTRDPEDALGPLFDYARACAEAGVPLDTTTLDAVYPAAVVRSVRATVAVAQLGSLVANTAEGLVARLQGGPRRAGLGALQEAFSFGASLPLVAPTLVMAGTMKVLTKLAPPMPRLELPPAGDANLVVHLLAEAAPTYLGHALVRTGLVWSPVPIAVAFRMEGVSATMRIGRGRVAIANGVASDVLAVIDGGIEPLLHLVAGSILKDLGVPVRRPS